jgi:hypothetical protein
VIADGPARWRALLPLLALLAATALLRLALGHVYFGFHTGDDVEILAAGARRALGWPYRPLEIRNLLLADGVVAPALALAAWCGARTVRALLWAASFPLVLLATCNVLLVFLLARRFLRSERPALLAATLYGLHWIPLSYGSMVYPRTASTSCVLLATLIVWERRGALWRAALAGGLIALAWAVRYSEVIFLAAPLAILWWRGSSSAERLRASAALLAGFATASLVSVGVADWLAWGRPFASLLAFARFTLTEGRSSSLHAVQPWYWYLWRSPKWLPPTLLPLLWRARRVPGSLPVAAAALAPLLALSLIPHKELRYLQGVLPFVVLLAAAGATSLWASGRRGMAAVFCALSLPLGLWGIPLLARKSMAAVEAAERLRASAPPGAVVCLSQSWAYGDALYLRGLTVRELGYPLRRPALASALPGCVAVAAYVEDLEREGARPLLASHGFVATGRYRWGLGRPVETWQRRPPLAPATERR